MSAVGKDPVFLNFFWDLASDEEGLRIDAAHCLIAYLTGKKIADAAKIPAQPVNEEIFDYAVKRLVRGLGSSRDSARQGFATCLAELLRNAHGHASLDFSNLLELLDANSKVSKKIQLISFPRAVFSFLVRKLLLVHSHLAAL